MQREQVLESVCRASLAVRRCRTSNHCSVAAKQGSGALCARLGAVVLAVSLASLQTTCCCYARAAQKHQRRILLALRDAYYYARTPCNL